MLYVLYFRLKSKTASVLRRIALWDCSRLAKASFIGDYETSHSHGAIPHNTYPVWPITGGSHGGVLLLKLWSKLFKAKGMMDVNSPQHYHVLFDKLDAKLLYRDNP